MIKHLLKQIWAQRSVNAWLWFELMIVSVCLFYVMDYLYVTGRLYATPLGFDTEHVYRVKLASIPPGGKEYKPGDTDSLKIEQWFSILSRLRAYPGVEAVSLSIGSHPYNQNSSSGSRGIDTTWVHGYVYNVSPDYFRVFRITDKQGKTESLVQAATQENTWIISAETEREFSAKGTDALGKGVKNWGETEPTHTIRGICNTIRFDDFYPLYPTYIECHSEAALLGWRGNNAEFCVRVRPDADGVDFPSRFRKDMKVQLRVGNFYLLDITSFDDLRENYYRSNEKINDVKTRIAALGFFLLNILMGVIGTFWIRTQQRRSEMGLRLALGSTRANLRSLLIGEGVLLLILATVPAAVISLNLAFMDLLTDTMPVVTVTRFLIVQAMTFVSIVVMIVIGICIPARQVMRIQPAEALHEE
jgi:putative ABC transport system permease protein